jgi:alkaline phosphatase
VTASGEWMGLEAHMRSEAQGVEMTVDFLEEIYLEFNPLDELTDRDREQLQRAVDSPAAWDPGQTMARILSPHALVGWTTMGHTGVDVTLHAYGPGSERLRGHLGNDEVGRIVAELLGVDLAAVTERVRAEMAPAGE